MMKRKFPVLIVAIAIITLGSSISLGTFGGAKHTTVLGIILGKSLASAGLRECRRSEGPYSFKEYDPRDTNCYQAMDCESDACFTQIIPELGFDLTMDVILLDNCDRQSPVQEIHATFDSGNYEKVLPLVIDRFGQPKKTEKSVVQNSMGVEFKKIESFWSKRELSIYLTNSHNEIGLGLLEIIRQDRKRSLAEKSRKDSESNRMLF